MVLNIMCTVYVDASASIAGMESETDSTSTGRSFDASITEANTIAMYSFRTSDQSWHGTQHACMMPWGVPYIPLSTFIYPRWLHKPTKCEVWLAILVRGGNTLLVQYLLDTWCKRYSDCRVQYRTHHGIKALNILIVTSYIASASWFHHRLHHDYLRKVNCYWG